MVPILISPRITVGIIKNHPIRNPFFYLMNEHVWFRLALTLACLTALVGWSAWGWSHYAAMRADSVGESRRTYQQEMAERCRSAPNFPACINNDEFLLGQAKAMLEGLQYREQARAIVPWAAGVPVAILLIFFLTRWILTGRVRPFWVLTEKPNKDDA
uniref:hypothetical protein n=1 Tax=Hylemonella sp. TaxID=2066020 RepID=UPI0035ADCD29